MNERAAHRQRKAAEDEALAAYAETEGTLYIERRVLGPAAAAQHLAVYT